ncbi:hypothetical protein NKR23_g5454 [Pleurostoma richardsiae]|uniref:Zn(2)-C6 fungal-type domain-containing protein n=1 Tax=Pleurostoma richardsiae TaxID=41990 RepID=A0AA38RTX1_9PEZI|nr:hypothetical protein NKR23_g5454 [Pleurostoma richardsiae]
MQSRSSYIPIQPRFVPVQEAGDDLEKSSRTSAGPLRHRSKTIAACEACRARKSRCSGTRPQCETCELRGTECVYSTGPGQTRYQGIMTEVAKLRSALEEAPTQLNTPSPSPPASKVPPSLRDHGSEDRDAPLDRLTPTAEHPSNGFDNPFDVKNIVRFLLQRVAVLEECFTYYVDCTDLLFCSYSRADAEALFLQVANAPVQWTKPLLCELCAMAAVGASFSGGRISTEAENYFYSVAKMFMDDCIELSPASAVKICTLLAARNIVAKPAVAMAYVELGLGLARNRRRISSQLRAETEMEQMSVKKISRCLVTLQFWLQATYGWCPEDADAADELTFHDVELQLPNGLRDDDLFQSELADVSLLKQKILRVLAAEDLPLASFATLRRSLGAWYEALPPEVHISNLAPSPIDSITRFKLYYLHLMHLGIILLLFRRFVRQYARHAGRSGLPTEAKRWAVDGPLAARQAARLTYLLYTEGGVLRHCWICISQAYLSGCVLIHVCLQRFLTGRVDADWYDDVELVNRILILLSDCARLDRIARSFEETLRRYFDLLSEAATQQVQFEGLKAGQSGSTPPDEYVLTCAPGETKYHVAGRELLQLIGRLHDDTIRPDQPEHLFRNTLISHEDCIVGIHREWIEEFSAIREDTDESTERSSKAKQILPAA